MDSLIGANDLRIVFLVLQIQFAFLCHVADGGGDIIEFPFVVVDGVYAYLRIDVHAPFDYNALGAEIQLFYVTGIDNLAERGHVKEARIEIEGIFL